MFRKGLGLGFREVEFSSVGRGPRPRPQFAELLLTRTICFLDPGHSTAQLPKGQQLFPRPYCTYTYLSNRIQTVYRSSFLRA